MMNRREFCLVLGVTALLQVRTPATLQNRIPATRTEVFVPHLYRNSQSETMPYRLFTPLGYDKRRKYPLVLWLHGGAGCGNDNLKQISGGNTIGSHVWTSPENQVKHPCFVVAPQCPENEMWAIGDGDASAQMRLALELLQSLKATFSVDAERLYVTGQSLGGFGTWAAITEHPHLFAAAIPVCGGGDESAAPNLTNVSIWAFHGEKDESVNVERSRKMIAAIRQAGGSARYTEYKGAGHIIWDKVFSEPELVPWVFAQTRK